MWGSSALKGGTTMKTLRRITAIGLCGIMLGTTMSVFMAAPADGRLYRTCDKKIENMERQAAKDYAKGKLSADDFDKVMSEIAYHRELWGC